MITAKEARDIRDGIYPMTVEQIEKQIRGQAERGQSQALFYAHELTHGVRAGLIMAGYELDEKEKEGFISVKWEG